MRANLARRSTAQSSIRAFSSEAPVNARIAHTKNVRIELLRCRSQATVQWSVTRPLVSLMWLRNKGSNARITMAGQDPENILPGRARFWFCPEGAGVEAELTGRGAYDCVGVFVEPSFLPAAVKQALARPIHGFSDDTLGRAFDEMAEELTEGDELHPIFTEGWAMQAFAFVVRATREQQPMRIMTGSGLAPWQLLRAKEMFLADLSETQSVDRVAARCKLSVSHFARAFKASTGVPPHQWLIKARIEQARALLVDSSASLADVAGTCGFADQSHFSRIFARVMGTSPGAWRREHRAEPINNLARVAAAQLPRARVVRGFDSHLSQLPQCDAVAQASHPRRGSPERANFSQSA